MRAGQGAPRFARLGAVARWKPVHLGHAAMLEAIADAAGRAVIAIGSANRYDARNPFTPAETRAMIDIVLAGRSNVDVIEIEDLGDGPHWRDAVRGRFGALDAFVTANDYVRSLLDGVYPLIHPLELIPPERRVAVDGTMVRAAMARGEGWDALCPPAVARFVRERGLDARFRREFGLETLALGAPAAPPAP